jgi:MraZ protein
VLLGEFRHSLDSKGRVFLPAKWRKELGELVILTKGLDACLFLLSPTEFGELSVRFDARPFEDEDSRAYSRVFFGQASEEPVDAQGRITIPAPLRAQAHLSKEIVLSGVSRRAEIWDRELYDAYQAEKQGQYEEIARKALSKGGTP